jgi:hypothetical protein
MNFASLNDAMFSETSSKENTGIKELFIKLLKKLCVHHLEVCSLTLLSLIVLSISEKNEHISKEMYEEG